MEENKTTIVQKTVKSGITFGSALAMVISYTTWKSVGWAIFHGLLSWVYVIYFVYVIRSEVVKLKNGSSNSYCNAARILTENHLTGQMFPSVRSGGFILPAYKE